MKCTCKPGEGCTSCTPKEPRQGHYPVVDTYISNAEFANSVRTHLPMTTKPAQSDAPSAEEIKAAQDWLNTPNEFHTNEFHTERDHKLLATYAALRTAQRDAEIAHLKAHNEFLTSNLTLTRAKVAQLERGWDELKARKREQEETHVATVNTLMERATAAESALSEARERAIQECVAVAERLSFQEGATVALNLRALLTSSASAKGEKS